MNVERNGTEIGVVQGYYKSRIRGDKTDGTNDREKKKNTERKIVICDRKRYED